MTVFDYYTIETEVTNICNANCVFCANKSLSRSRGFINVEAFQKFIETQSKLVENNIFKLHTKGKYPRVAFCGLGEPLLHPQINELVKTAHDNGFFTQLVTNGALLSPKIVQGLCENHLDELAISLHSVNSLNYKQITGLPLDVTLQSIENSIDALKSYNLKTSFWRIRHPQDKYADTVADENKYQELLRTWNLPNCTVLGPSNPWSRDGVVPNSKCQKVCDSVFWCNKIYFTFNIDWQGNVILCCTDYNRETINLGNVFSSSFDYDKLFKRKLNILSKKEIPEICKNCRRWEDTEIFDILSDAQIEMDHLKKHINHTIKSKEY